MKEAKTVAFLFLLFLVSCSTKQQIKDEVTKVISENPQILADAIEKNPVVILTALQNASKNAQNELAKQKEAEEKKALEETFNNPIKVTLRKDEAIRGAKNAPITLVEYSDFECPFCSRGFETVKKLMNKYDGKIKFVYKHLPLSFHPQAMISAQYYEALRLQNDQLAFKFHDEIFKNQSKLSGGETFLKAIAKELGADMKKLAVDVKSKTVQSRIDEDVAEAGQLGFQGTPGFLLNGVPVKGAYPEEYFVQIIDELQKRGKVTL